MLRRTQLASIPGLVLLLAGVFAVESASAQQALPIYVEECNATIAQWQAQALKNLNAANVAYSLECVRLLQAGGPRRPPPAPPPPVIAPPPPAAPPAAPAAPAPAAPAPGAPAPAAPAQPSSAAVAPPQVPVEPYNPPVVLPPPPPVGGIAGGDAANTRTAELTVEGCKVVTPTDPRLYAACADYLKAQGAAPQDAAPQAPPAAADQPVRGTIEKGTFKLIPHLSGRESPASVGGAVGPGDTIVTASEGATVALDDGSRIEVGPNSRVTLGAGPEPAVEQKIGRVFYDIKSRAESRRFNVNVVTPKGRYFIAVKGTQFTVEVAEDGSGTVQVTEGVVEVTSADKTVALQAGSSLAVRPGEAPSDPADAGGSRAPSPAVLFAIGAALLVAAGGAGLVVRRRRTQG